MTKVIERARRLLAHKPGGVFNSNEVSEIRGASSVEAAMFELIPLAAEFARPEISSYSVGAVGLGASGALILGANFEFSEAALAQTVHAEQCMIANALGAGENGLQRIAISAPPCGHCRQFMNELANAEALRVIIPGEPDTLLGSFLPKSFGPKELGIVGGLMSSQNHGLKIDVGLSELAEVAIEAANSSYAPYSKSPAGIAMSFTDKTIITGSYLENAAFNPSLPALQMALARMTMAAKSPSNIREIAFADTVNSRIDHFSFARDFFKRKVPEVKIEYFQLNNGEKDE